GAPPPKPEQWWNEPEAGAKINGTLQRFECLGRQAKVVVETGDGNTVQLLVRDTARIVLVNGGEKALSCGPQRPGRHVSVARNPPTRQLPHRSAGSAVHSRAAVP